jgi:hypothetical protein
MDEIAFLGGRVLTMDPARPEAEARIAGAASPVDRGRGRSRSCVLLPQRRPGRPTPPAPA